MPPFPSHGVSLSIAGFEANDARTSVYGLIVRVATDTAGTRPTQLGVVEGAAIWTTSILSQSQLGETPERSELRRRILHPNLPNASL